MKSLRNTITYTLVIIGFFFVAPTAHAARLYIDTDRPVFGVDQEVILPLMLDPEGMSINALDIKLAIPANLTFKEFYDGESMIETWLEFPHSDAGHLIFSGIIPGGFAGLIDPFNSQIKKPGVVGRLVFQTGSSGNGSITTTTDTAAYENDGEGTAISLTFSPFAFEIKDGAYFSSSIPVDTTPPESFIPTLSKDENAYEGKYFVVFQAKDRGVGIDHYEVKEGNRNFITATSPYVLVDQYLSGPITIKAVDRSGSVRVAQITPTPLPHPRLPLGILIGIFLLGIICYVVINHKRHRHTH